MPSFSQRLRSEHLDLHAELGELLGARGELGGPEHVGRLVDEIARERDAVGHARAPSANAWLAALRIGAMNDDLLQRSVVGFAGGAVFLAPPWSCIF